MAYDDVLAKFLIIIELNTLKKKITANTITARYRDGQGFSSELIKSATNVLDKLYALLNNSTHKIRLNKATTLSWMLFIYVYMRKDLNINWLEKFFYEFESFKIIKEQKIYNIHSDYKYELINDYLIGIYLDRASARVADTMSVILRDFVLWAAFYLLNKVDSGSNELISILNDLENKKNDDSVLENLVLELNWGVEL